MDDEPLALEGLKLSLRAIAGVVGCESGALGLDAIERLGPFAVIISDMQMPVMDGATFLALARQRCPDAVRLLLTGHASIDAAIQAVNEGQIFRFLTKPCAPPVLLKTVGVALEQHRLITAEKVLLERTLHGSIRAFLDVLSLANPVAFGRGTRIRRLVSEVSSRQHVANRWEVELAAMFAQLGGVALPSRVAEKLHTSGELTEPEQALVEHLPAVTQRLLEDIPRLDGVRAIVSNHMRLHSALIQDSDLPPEILAAASILRVAVDFDQLQGAGKSSSFCVSLMRGRSGWYSPAALDALAAVIEDKWVPNTVSLQELTTGMVLVDDVISTTDGSLMVPRGYEVNRGLLERLRLVPDGTIRTPLRVIARTGGWPERGP